MSDDPVYETDLLDFFAASALAGMLASGLYHRDPPGTVADDAWRYARNMVAVRAERQPKGGQP